MASESFKIKLPVQQQRRWESFKLPDETLAGFIKDAVDDYCLSLEVAKSRLYAKRVTRRAARLVENEQSTAV